MVSAKAGRADQTILHHLKVAKIIDFGAQGQLRTGDTPQAFNGFREFGDSTDSHSVKAPIGIRRIGLTLARDRSLAVPMDALENLLSALSGIRGRREPFLATVYGPHAAMQMS